MSERGTAKTAAGEVIERVREMIRRGELRTGDQLPAEREFARQLGINRTSLRAGLRSLIAMGVLESRQGSGTFIVDAPPLLNSEALEMLGDLHGFTQDEVFEARQVLEATVAAMAAERATSEQLTCMAEEVISLYASMDDPQQFLVHDLRFHRLIAAAAGNPVLAAVAGTVSALHYELRSRTVRRSSALRVAAEMHQSIFRAIRGGDAAAARTAMRNHILQAQMDYLLEPAGRPEAQEPARQDGAVAEGQTVLRGKARAQRARRKRVQR